MAAEKVCRVEGEGTARTLRCNYNRTTLPPSVEDSDQVMATVIESLATVGTVSKIILEQHRDYEYDDEQANMLYEIAEIFKGLVRDRPQPEDVADSRCPTSQQCISRRLPFLYSLIYSRMPSDPIGAYVELRRLIRREEIKSEKSTGMQQRCQERFISFLKQIAVQLQQTTMMRLAGEQVTGYHVGDRSLYASIFKPSIKPNYMQTRLMAAYPPAGIEVESYRVGGAQVTIFEFDDKVQKLYHVVPPEFQLTESKYQVLDTAQSRFAEYKPEEDLKEVTDPMQVRRLFSNIAYDMITDIAKDQNVSLRSKDIEELAAILNRYTIGFGLIEVLLADQKVQDVTINSPFGKLPVFMVHATAGDCYTNVYPTPSEAISWASKLRIISGRPLNEANPILDYGLDLPGGVRTRVAVVGSPLNPHGKDALNFAFRRHPDRPWTLPAFLASDMGMLNAESAGLMSFLVDGARTMLVAGTRSAGKTSLLQALMVEIQRKHRIITIEDTLELPINALIDIGYNIQPMKVASALTRGTAEVSASEGIRTTLRLGDSALIVGEVRSDEARALYEAMRVGALANVVAGTIHGDSPYGVYDRVVNDLNVPATSFKATDLVIIANRIPMLGRRITSITEIGKYWEEDPLLENGFLDLMKYDRRTDSLQMTSALINGESDVLKDIGGRYKAFAGNWDAIMDNIILRGKVKARIAEVARQLNKVSQITDAKFVVTANDIFTLISAKVLKETDSYDPKLIFSRWDKWLTEAAKTYNG